MIGLVKKIITKAAPAGGPWLKLALTGYRIYQITKFFTMKYDLVSKKDIKWLARLGDNVKKFKNPLLELADYYFWYILILLAVHILEKKKVSIPEKWENPIKNLIALAKAKDVKAIGEQVADEANKHVDIPFIDESAERQIFLYAYGLIEIYVYKVLVLIEEKGKPAVGDEQE